ncbi:hypothetical protein Haur_2075 [Herpetosiphon aurantiacus DSM 785]|uniref:Putative regulatory protein FmdB zinc ribbon domain-containing protein n=1 Tax=Herpetosiphon aurantiacus (strain ATCC 23779 / DSM 785 / 114-95) TaxID=316274 RepID=A9AW65_HERA2|nr:hypothetical protein Haur_2075 [Herpetosiphon aurantiacus DSM 785]
MILNATTQSFNCDSWEGAICLSVLIMIYCINKVSSIRFPMPLYVYSCPQCAIEIEELRPQREADMPFVCPVCHEFGVRDITSFHLWRNQPSPELRTPSTGDKDHHPSCACCRPYP